MNVIELSKIDGMTATELYDMYRMSDIDTKLDMVRASDDQDFFAKLVNDENEEIRVEVAKRANQHIVSKLAIDRSVSVRLAVAENTCSIITLMIIGQDAEEIVRMAAAERSRSL